MRVINCIGEHFYFAAFLCLLCIFPAAQAEAIDQEITLTADTTAPAGAVYVNVRYDCADTAVTALGVRIHFDSTKLSYTGYDNYFSTGAIANPQLQDDTENKDYDGNTDQLILIGYQDMDGGWPGQTLPMRLIRLKFTASGGSTALKATKTTGAAGYGFTGTGVTLAAPELTTSVASAITESSAASGGDVISDGGASVTARGVCWSTSQNPTVSNNKTSNGSGAGSFSSSIAGLSPNTTYYVRAYAVNSLGTGYRNQVSFTTAQPVTVPSVTT